MNRILAATVLALSIGFTIPLVQAGVGLAQVGPTGLTARIAPEAGEAGPREWNVYMGAVYNGLLYLRCGGTRSWCLYTSGAFPVAGQANLSAGSAIVTVADFDISGSIGLDVYVGYGLSDADVSAPGHLAKIYTVPTPTPTPKPIPTPAPVPAGTLPLIDGHDHITPGLAVETIISLMDKAGVQKLVAMANRIGPTDPMGYEESLVLAVYEKYPDRIVPFLTAVRWGFRFRDATFLEYAERQLQTGKFKGMGEFMVKHYAVPPLPGETATAELTLPADSPGMQDMMRLGAQYNVPLVIHMETEPDTVAALERALLANPNTKVIWAHQNPLKMGGGSEAQYARQSDPNQIAALLDRHPNLFADISLGYEGMFLDQGRDRQLPESWKNLYEKYNDRFVVGIDRAYKTTFENGYVSMADWHRGWLLQLSSATAKKLAYENAERILSLGGTQK